MAGKFYSLKEVILDKNYLISLGASIVGCGICVATLSVYLAQKRVAFQEIARVTIASKSDDASNLKPVSEISEINPKNNTEYFGYISDIDEVCGNDLSTGNEQTVLVRQANGVMVVGKIKISAKVCKTINDILDNNKEYKVHVVSSSRVGDQPLSYLSVHNASKAGS